MASDVLETDSPWQTIPTSNHIKVRPRPKAIERLSEDNRTQEIALFFMFPKKFREKKKTCFIGDEVEDVSVLKT